MDDPLVKPKADIDQMVAFFPEYARVLHGFYNALVGEGFAADEALSLTVQWAKATIWDQDGSE